MNRTEDQTGSPALPDTRLSEAEVKAVLEKAVRIEGRGATTVAELSDAAREAGISEAALLEAMREVLAERGNVASTAPVAPAGPARGQARWLAPLGFAAAGALSGALVLTLGGLSLGLLGIGIGFRAFDHRRDRNFRQYELETTAGLGSWAIASMLFGPHLDNLELATAFGMLWTAFSAVGTGVIATGPRAPTQPDAGGEAALPRSTTPVE